MRRAAVPVLVFALSVAACSNGSDPTPSRSFDDVSFLVANGGQVDSYQELLAEVSFTPLIPSEDPPGTVLTQLVVSPSASGDADVAARTTDLQLTFTAGGELDPTGAVMLIQSIAGVASGDGEPVDISGVAGRMAVVEGHGSIWWRHCDLGFLLAFTPGAITETEAIAFAASTVSDCPARDT